nr:hypothetical protein [Tanacetum cinerariifolium]
MLPAPSRPGNNAYMSNLGELPMVTVLDCSKIPLNFTIDGKGGFSLCRLLVASLHTVSASCGRRRARVMHLHTSAGTACKLDSFDELMMMGVGKIYGRITSLDWCSYERSCIYICIGFIIICLAPRIHETPERSSISHNVVNGATDEDTIDNLGHLD